MKTVYHAPEKALLETLDSCNVVEALVWRGHSGMELRDIASIVSEAGRFASTRLAPFNYAAAQAKALLVDGRVRLPPGTSQAYRLFREAGWASVPFENGMGGANLPWSLQVALSEIWCSANSAFSQIVLLTQGAIVALEASAPAWMKALWLPKLVSGEWSAAMGMTEPQAGSDLGQVQARAVANAGVYHISGTKIFTTYADQDCTENIIHLVLARLPGAPKGTAGLSLFAVPTVLVEATGQLGPRNAVRVLALERKIGFHASATCTTEYGDGERGAVGYLVGRENGGLAALFPMLNSTRLATAVQAVGLAERARQQACAYAVERRQGRSITGSGDNLTISEHPDVRRMLEVMSSVVAASRTLTLFTAGQIDLASYHSDARERSGARQRLALLTPVVKAWTTDRSLEVTSLGIQIYGGAGYIEETGVAQHWLEARVGPIYEGTNGIQAIDFCRRKLASDNGAALHMLLDRLALTWSLTAQMAPSAADELETATAALRELVNLSVDRWQKHPDVAATVASELLEMTGTVLAGWLLAEKAACIVSRHGRGDASEATNTVTKYAELILPRWRTHERVIRSQLSVA